jgi:hypothetical protein
MLIPVGSSVPSTAGPVPAPLPGASTTAGRIESLKYHSGPISALDTGVTQMANIICSACKKEIKTRQDLAVVGRSFVTYHRMCFKRSRGLYKFYSGYPINSVAMWVILALLNAALWASCILFAAPLKETFYFSLFSLVLFIGFRLIAYLGYEIKLPRK